MLVVVVEYSVGTLVLQNEPSQQGRILKKTRPIGPTMRPRWWAVGGGRLVLMVVAAVVAVMLAVVVAYLRMFLCFQIVRFPCLLKRRN